MIYLTCSEAAGKINFAFERLIDFINLDKAKLLYDGSKQELVALLDKILSSPLLEDSRVRSDAEMLHAQLSQANLGQAVDEALLDMGLKYEFKQASKYLFIRLKRVKPVLNSVLKYYVKQNLIDVAKSHLELESAGYIKSRFLHQKSKEPLLVRARIYGLSGDYAKSSKFYG